MVMRSGIAPMKAKARMLQSHRDMILDYFLAKKEYSSCVVEGLNTKVKLVTGKSYGYRMTATIKIAPFLFIPLDAYPSPNRPQICLRSLPRFTRPPTRALCTPMPGQNFPL